MKSLKLFGMALIAMLLMVSCSEEPEVKVASSTVTVRSSDWYWQDDYWRVDIAYDAISPDVHDYGAVIVYMDNGNTWRQIPLTYYYQDTQNGNIVNCSASLEVSTYENGVSIFWTENDFYNGNRPGDHRFKIVVISSEYQNARPDVDYSDYQAVKEAFQLND